MRKIIKRKNKKIGILGGTFDPPHKGHLYISKIALRKLKLDKLIWVITKKNPLKKKPYLSAKTRMKLSKKISNKVKKIFIKCENKQIKSSNTFDLIKSFKKNKKIDLYFLIGADNLSKFHKWHQWEKIPKLCKMVVFPRKNYSIKSFTPNATKKLDKRDWIYISTKKIDISSSFIRKFW